MTTRLGIPANSTFEKAFGVASQSDGKTIVVGQADNDFALMRLTTDGVLDHSFGLAGKITTNFNDGVDIAYAVAVQDDDRFVVAGRISDDFGVARYLADGTLDESFGSGGEVTVPFGDPGSLGEAYDLAIQSDGKIVVVGRAPNGGASAVDFGVVRLNSDGTLDSGFGTGGLVSTDFPGGDSFDSAQAVALQSDGKIVVAGQTDVGSYDSFAIARYLADGTLDNSFGSGGLVTIDPATANAFALDVGLQSDGSIVVLGTGIASLGGNRAIMARLDGNGSLDASFATNGIYEGFLHRGSALVVNPDDSIVYTGKQSLVDSGDDFGFGKVDSDGIKIVEYVASEDNSQVIEEEVHALVRQNDGKFVLVGSSSLGSSGPGDGADMAVLRLDADLNLDGGFNLLGTFATWRTDGNSFEASDVSLLSDGRVVAVGNGIFEGQVKTVVFSLNSDGTFDQTFHDDGSSYYSWGSEDTQGNALAVQADGKLILVGKSTDAGGDSDFSVFRLLADGSFDPSFSDDGGIQISHGAMGEVGRAVAIQDDGKIVIGGDRDGDFDLLRLNDDGALDASFGTGGGVTTPLASPGNASCHDVLIQPDGAILAGGVSNGDFVLMRFLTDGQLDGAFGTGGIVVTDLGSADTCHGIALQGDGKILAAGESNGNFVIVRYQSDGSIDGAYGVSGVATTDLGSSTAGARDIAILQDGRSVVAGKADGLFAVAVFDSSGSLDPNFSADGWTTNDILDQEDEAHAVAVQTDGKIVVAGLGATADGVDGFAFARYRSDGSVDDWGNGPIIELGEFPVEVTNAKGLAVAEQEDKKIVVAGSVANTEFVLARYLPDGSLDGTFGKGGKAVTDIESTADTANDVLLQDDGRIVVAGYSYNSSTGISDFSIARYNSDGSLDLTFDFDGRKRTNIGSWDVANTVLLQDDGKLIAVGHTYPGSGSRKVALVRYLESGALDTSFGVDGITQTNVTSANDSGEDALLLPDGRILVAATVDNDFALLRYNADGSLDTTFASSGVARTDISTSSTDTARSIALQDDGRIVVAGSSTPSGGYGEFALVRYMPDGTLDTSFGTAGIVRTAAPAGSYTANTAAIYSENKIVVMGTWFDGSVIPHLSKMLAVQYDASGAIDTTFGTSGIATLDIDPQNFEGIDDCVVTKEGDLVGTGFVQVNGRSRIGIISLEGSPPCSIAPYTADGDTVLLDHFDGAALVTPDGFENNGQPCGSALPAADPAYAFLPGIDGLGQALEMSRPEGKPAGSATYLQYPGGAILGIPNGTLEYWVYMEDYSEGIRVDQGPYFGACSGWTFGMGANGSGQLSASAWAAFDLNSGGTIVPLGQWTHVAVTWGALGAKLYINGIEVDSDPSTAAPSNGFGTSLLVSGKGGSSTTMIDELRISSVQRTSFDFCGNFNQAPVIRAVPAITVPVGTTANLTLNVTDPDEDNLLTTMASAPAGATYNSLSFSWTPLPGDAGTTVTATFQADDQRALPNSVTSRTVDFIVPADYDGDSLNDGWEWDNFGSLNQSDDADFDGDGLTNFMEYALGSDPAVASPGANPSASVMADTIEYTYNKARSELSYSVEYSVNLTTWSTDGVDQGGSGPSVTAIVPIGGNSRTFVRLKVVPLN